jgi:recombinational DNA repair protein RecR
MYNISCNQRGTFILGIMDKPENFNSLDEVKDFLIEYHSIDNSLKELKKLNLNQILEIFDWSIIEIKK